MIRVVIADDHAMLRAGVARALTVDDDDVRVVAEAADGLQALDAVAAKQPNVLVVDLDMPALGGIEVTRRVAQNYGMTKVVVLSYHGADTHAAEAFRAGAHAYLQKDCRPSRLLSAVRAASEGKRFSPGFEAVSGVTDGTDAWDTLTAREREVAVLLGEGYTHSETATRLGISPRTVEVHRSNLTRKLGKSTTAELVRYLIRRGVMQG